MVYFIECEGMVKIGYTQNTNRRLSCLRTSNPLELIVRLVIEGGVELEQQLHNTFKNYHHRGEWFLYSDEIKQFIKDNDYKDLRYDLGLLNNYKEIRTETAKLRNILHLTLRDVGELLDITPQSVKEIETRESMGTASINCLRGYANALGYRLVYKFIKVKEDEKEEDSVELDGLL